MPRSPKSSVSFLHALICGGQDSPSFYKLPTRLTEIKTDYPNFCNPPTRFQWSERTLQTSASFLHALRWSKRTLRSTKMLLHASRWSKQILRASRILLHALRWSKRTLRTSEPPTRIAVVKTDYSNYYKPPTHFRWMKGLSELLQASCTICGGQNGLSELNYTMVILREGHRTIRNIATVERMTIYSGSNESFSVVVGPEARKPCWRRD